MKSIRYVFVGTVFWAVVTLVFSQEAFAQCAMCSQSIAASADAATVTRGLNIAVTVLLIPPVVLFSGLFGLFYKYRNMQGKQFRVINDE